MVKPVLAVFSIQGGVIQVINTGISIPEADLTLCLRSL